METTPLLVLLPGMDGTALLFAPLLRALPPSVDALALAYPTDVHLGYDELVARVIAILPLDRPFVLAAESFSGPIAVRVAARSPPGLVGVVLVATFVSSPMPWLPAVVAELPARLLFALPLPALVVRWFMLGWPASAEIVSAVRAAVRMVRPSVLVGRLLDVLQVEVRAELCDVTVPILHLQGTGDWLVGARAARDVAAANHRVLSRHLDGPHLLFQVCPEHVVTTIATFLAGLGVDQRSTDGVEPGPEVSPARSESSGAPASASAPRAPVPEVGGAERHGDLMTAPMRRIAQV